MGPAGARHTPCPGARWWRPPGESTPSAAGPGELAAGVLAPRPHPDTPRGGHRCARGRRFHVGPLAGEAAEFSGREGQRARPQRGHRARAPADRRAHAGRGRAPGQAAPGPSSSLHVRTPRAWPTGTRDGERRRRGTRAGGCVPSDEGQQEPPSPSPWSRRAGTEGGVHTARSTRAPSPPGSRSASPGPRSADAGGGRDGSAHTHLPGAVTSHTGLRAP